MGANAQTTVPTFTTSQVLTAAQQNQSARTGVPVFASTVTRDAAFGGTGEKTLAEGQLCYVEGTGLQTYNGTSWVTWGTAPATSGLAVVKSETAFSAASTVTADNIFTSTYTNYRLVVRYQTSSTGNVLLKFRAGGVNTSTNYNLQVEYIQNTTLTGARLLNRSSIDVGVYTNGSFNSFFICEIIAPNVLTQTLFNINNAYGFGAYTSPEYFLAGGNQTATTQFDGIELSTGLGTMTGEYTVYGYAKS